MTAIKWDQVGERLYESGVEQCALYPQSTTGDYNNGVGWNGVTKIAENPDGAGVTPIHANNRTYGNLVEKENFKGSISAYTYPDEWEMCDGSATPKGSDQRPITGVYVKQQTRTPFGLAFKTLIGNDTQGLDLGYKLHLVYNAIASPSSRDNTSINDSPEALEMSWDFSTVPVDVPGMKPSAHIIIDSRTTNSDKLKKFEKVLYGSDEADPRLPLPKEVFTMLGQPG